MPFSCPTPSGPENLFLMLSRRCRANCGICYVRHEASILGGARRGDATPLFGIKSMPPGDMDPAIITPMLAAYTTVTSVEFNSLGETFDYPAFDEAFARAVAFMPRLSGISITSNGSRLDEHPQVLAIPGTLTVSVDSPDPARCDALRPGTDGARVWRNVEAAARGPRHPRHVMNVNMIVSAENADEISAMATRLHSLGILALTVVRAIHLSGDRAADELPFDAPGPRRAILEARRSHPQMSIANHFTYFDGGLTTSVPGSGHCQSPFTRMLVDASGHGRLCCRIQDHDLGHMLTGDPWRSDAMWRLRSRVLSGSFPMDEFAACATCHSRHGFGADHLVG